MESGNCVELYTQSGVGVTVVLSISIFDVPDRTTGISSKGIGFSSGDDRFPGPVEPSERLPSPSQGSAATPRRGEAMG